MRSERESIDPALAPFHRRRWHPGTPCRRPVRQTVARTPGAGGIPRSGVGCWVLAKRSRSLCFNSCSAPQNGVDRNSELHCFVNIDNFTANFRDIQAHFGSGCEFSHCLVRRLRTIARFCRRRHSCTSIHFHYGRRPASPRGPSRTPVYLWICRFLSGNLRREATKDLISNFPLNPPVPGYPT